MMQLEILNHHCFVCIKKERKEKRKEENKHKNNERIEYTQIGFFKIFYFFCSKKKSIEKRKKKHITTMLADEYC